MLVDDDAPFFHRHAGGFEAEALRVRPAAGGDQHDIRSYRLGGAAGDRLHRHGRAGRTGLNTRDLAGELEDKTLLLQHALELLGDITIHARQDAVEELDDGNVRAEAPPDRAELEPDYARAHDNEMFGHRRQLQRTGR